MTAGRNYFGLGALVFGAVLALGAGTTAYGQGGHTHGGGDGNHQQREKRAEKRHQKDEKEALKQHQREEREYYGNDRAVREHQRQEKEQEKYHRRQEERQRKAHQRDERNGAYDDGYYGNRGGSYDPYGARRDDGYYGDGGYSGNRQAVFDRGYQEGVRAGRDDRARNRQSDYERHRTYRDASGGYGDADAFREGFRRGYDEGYRDGRYSRGGGWGSVLGGIFGRP